MALPSVGGGYQPSDGNVNEVKLGTQATPVAIPAGAASLTAAQLTNGLILGSPGTSAAAYTLPTAAVLDAYLGNAHNGSSFDFSVINVDGSSSGVITMTTNTGTKGMSGRYFRHRTRQNANPKRAHVTYPMRPPVNAMA